MNTTYKTIWRRPIVVALLMFLCHSIQAQSLDVEIEAPLLLSQCGILEPVQITVRNVSGSDTIRHLRGQFVFPPGMFARNLTSISGQSIIEDDVSDTLFFPDLLPVAPNDSLVFQVELGIDCGIVSQSASYIFETYYDTTATQGDSRESEVSNAIQLQSADLSIPVSEPSFVNAYLGLTDTISTTIANGGNGALDTFYYLVSDNHPNATLIDLQVAGISLLPATQTETGFQAFVGPPIGVNEEIIIQEIWMITGCENPSDPILRRVQYGCEGDFDCQEKEQGVFPATGIFYDVAIPILQARLVSVERPACYAEVAGRHVMEIVNTGTAPAQEIVTQISVSSGLIDFDLGYTIEYLNGVDPESIVDIMQVSPACGDMLLQSFTDTIRNVSLLPNDTLRFTYYTLGDCDCNNCNISGVYRSLFSVRSYTNPCGIRINDISSAGTQSYDASMDGYVEGPFELNNGNTGTIEYPITSWVLDWFTGGNFQDAFIESTITLECGIDYVDGTAVLRDRNGLVFPLCTATYMDKNEMDGGVDSLILRWCRSDLPGSFVIGPSASLEFDVVADCSEKPMAPDCANPLYVVNISQTTDLVIDASCDASCSRQKIWQAEDFEIYTYCPEGGCGCEGVVFSSFQLERKTLGLGDTNNDGIPDGSPVLEQLQLDRFIKGDTIEASYYGSVRDPSDLSLQYGYAELILPHEFFLPVGAEAHIFDVSGDVAYTCSNLGVEVDTDAQTLRVDFSSAAMHGFGCGIPADFDHDDGDSIVIRLRFKIQRDLIDPSEIQSFQTRFYISEAAYGLGTAYQCNQRRGLLRQIGINQYSTRSFPAFGACDLPGWSIVEGRYMGYQETDEFPGEVRSIGMTDEVRLIKPPGFRFVPEQMGVFLHQSIQPAHNIVSQSNGANLGAFIIESANELVFLAAEYFESLANLEIPPDEGYRFTFRPRIQGTCQSMAGSYPFAYQLTSRVDPDIFGTSLLTRDTQALQFTYTGGAVLQTDSEESLIRLCSAADSVVIRVSNITPVNAPNAYLYFSSATGGVLVGEVVDLQADTVIIPNEFGIAAIANIPANTTRRYQLRLTANTCVNEILDVVAGWDCSAVPEVIEQAVCSDPASIYITSAETGMNLDVLQPVEDTLVALCDTSSWIVEIRSTDLGYLRDIGLEAIVPPGLIVIPGSFTFAYPGITQDGVFTPIPDPVFAAGGFYYDVTALHPVLQEVGLVGSKDLTHNTLNIRFETTTTCSFFSGSYMNFILTGKKSCGDPLVPKSKPSRRLLVTDMTPDFDVDISLPSLNMNPCNQDTVTSGVNLQLTSGAPSSLDSVRMVLPPGIRYVDQSYQAGVNANPSAPQVHTVDGHEILIWPMNAFLKSGDQVQFTVDLTAVDIGQSCTIYEMSVQAFSRTNAQCGASDCSIGIVAGEGIQLIQVLKPELDFVSMEGTLMLEPANGTADLMVEAIIRNMGAYLRKGTLIRLGLYEDVDLSGDRSVGDDYLYTLETILQDDLYSGGNATITGMGSFPSGDVCTIVAELNPDTTCTCSTVPSLPFIPDIEINFDQSYSACGGDLLSIGPDPILNYNYQWYALNGAPIQFLSGGLQMTPIQFQGSNFSNEPATYQYVLRSATRGCYTLDTVAITMAPGAYDSLVVQGCLNTAYALPAPPTGSSNYSWSPATGLTFPTGGMDYAVISPVTTSQIYRMTYTDPEGCAGLLVVNFIAQDCGTAVASLGDTVWFDENEDGLQSVGEPGIPDVQVHLYDATTGSWLGSTATNADGAYLFSDLPPGNFRLGFVEPSGMQVTSANAGADVLDSDVDAQGQTGTYYVGAGVTNLTIDAGFIPDCSLSLQSLVSDCMPTDSGLVRKIEVIVDWEGMVYTYDFLGGKDTLLVEILSSLIPIEIDTVQGRDTLIIYQLWDSARMLEVSVTSARLPGCQATQEATSFESCSYDLALKKTVLSSGPYVYGQDVEYQIVIFNQGPTPAKNILITDYLADGFEFLSEPNPGWGLDGGGNLKYTLSGTMASMESDTIGLVLSTRPSLEPNAWVNAAEITRFESIDGVNMSAFDEDSSPDDIPNNDAGGLPLSPADDALLGNGTGIPGDGHAFSDEDDHDPAWIDVSDLALIKLVDTVTTEQTTQTDLSDLQYGDTIVFKIVTINQGNVTVGSYTLSDYLPEGLQMIDPGVLNANWMKINPGLATHTKSLVSELGSGESDTVLLYMTLEPITVDQDHTEAWVNRVELSDARDTIGISLAGADADFPLNDNREDNVGGLPGTGADNAVVGNGTATGLSASAFTDQDSEDPALIQFYDLALRKRLYTQQPIRYGDILEFRLTVYNQGNQPVDSLLLVDSFDMAYSLVQLPGYNDAWEMMGSMVSQTVRQVIMPGDSVTVSLFLQLSYDQELRYHNVAAISQAFHKGLPISDIDSPLSDQFELHAGGAPDSPADNHIDGDGTGTPGDGTAEADHDASDPALIQVFDLALIKQVDASYSSGPFVYGDTVKYNLIIENQGNVPVEQVVLADYSVAGLELDPDLTLNQIAGWQANETLTLTDRLYPGSRDSVAVYLLVRPDTAARSYVNFGEIISARDTIGQLISFDADSYPGSNTIEERSVLPGDAGDNDWLSAGRSEPGSEDDHDPAGIEVLTVSLGNSVFADANNNGSHDPSEPGLSGVVLLLFDSTGWQVPVGSDGILGTPDDGPEGIATDMNGRYHFQNLAPGRYYVEIPPSNFEQGATLHGWTWSSDTTFFRFSGETDPDDDLDGDDDGIQPSGDLVRSYVINLSAGQEPAGSVENGPGGEIDDAADSDGNMTVDFGFYAPHSIGNRVWEDDNNNGILDVDEAHVAGVIVVLHYVDTLAGIMVSRDTQITDDQGWYQFNRLIEGDYIVEIPAANFEAGGVLHGWVSSTGNQVDNLSSGPFESPLGPIDVDSDLDADDNGAYDRASLFPMSPGGYRSVVSDTLTLSDQEPLVHMEAGDMDTSALDSLSNFTVDFGFVPLHSIGSHIWIDADNDGLRTGAEDNIAGVQLVLHAFSEGSGFLPVDTTVTDFSGWYLFDSLIAGAYMVEVTPGNFSAFGPLEGFVSSTGSLFQDLTRGAFEKTPEPLTDIDNDDNGNHVQSGLFSGSVVSDTILLDKMEPLGEGPPTDPSGALDSLSNLTLDFGFTPLHSIGNRVWLDRNNNGQQDVGESTISGVDLMLYYLEDSDWTLLDSIMSDAEGYYLFDSLISGAYQVVIPADVFAAGGLLEGFTSSSGGRWKLGSGPNEPAPDPNLDVDHNDDGTVASTSLWNGAVVSDTIYLSGSEPVGESPNRDLSTARDSLSNMTVDFGLVPLHTIGNSIWNDADNNGLMGPGELPLASVPVVLHWFDDTDDFVPIDTLYTDGDGLFLFDSLIAGLYRLEVPAAAFAPGGILEGFASSTGAWAGSGPYEPAPDPDDNIDEVDDGSIQLYGNQEGSLVTLPFEIDDDEPLGEFPSDNSGALDSLSNLTIDFGLFEPVAIGDYVWIDLNENGIQDVDEAPLPGVTVTLFHWDDTQQQNVPVTTNAFGRALVAIQTDQQGYYLFDSLPPGDYVVHFDVATALTGDDNAVNWQITYQDAGTDDSQDSDADEETGFTIPTGFLPGGSRDTTIDAGFFAPRFDLALVKSLAPDQDMIVNPDDTVTMWILVSNQGNTATGKYFVNDVLPSGMEFVDAYPSPVAHLDSMVLWCDSLPDLVGLENYAVDTFVIRAWINPVGQGLRDFQFRNWAEISSDNAHRYGVSDEDSYPDNDSGYDDDDGPGRPPMDPFVQADYDDIMLDTMPDDEDDSDYSDVFTRRFDLALTKYLSPDEPDMVVLPGDTVSFILEVCNQGNTDTEQGLVADNIELVDYIPVNLDLVEENGWKETGTRKAMRTLRAGEDLPRPGLMPDSCTHVEIRFTMNDMIFAETFNYAEIASATDTNDIQILDFDSDLDTIQGDLTVDGVNGDNAFEGIDTDGDGIVDEDDHDFARILSCLDMQCYARLDLALDEDCLVEITPDMLLRDPRLALARPDFYRVTLEVGNGIRLSQPLLSIQHRGQRIMASIEWVGPSACTGGQCMTEIHLGGVKRPVIEGTVTRRIYCTDPLLDMDPDSESYPAPTAFETCSMNTLPVRFVSDWVEQYDCSGDNRDTAKMVYREWEAISSEGIRMTAFDTLIVFRLPPISASNLFCQERDTIYCGDAFTGPYLLLPDLEPEAGDHECDTVYLMPTDSSVQSFAGSCGLFLQLSQQSFVQSCERIQLFTLSIKQHCYGNGPTDPVCEVGNSDLEILSESPQEIYASCSFWLIELDTTPPISKLNLETGADYQLLYPDGSISQYDQVHCFDMDQPVIVVAASTSHCAGNFKLPALCVKDECSDVSMVKARFNGSTYLLEAGGDSCDIDQSTYVQYQSREILQVFPSDLPQQIVYEVYDRCYNFITDTAYVIVKDRTAPTLLTADQLNVTLNGETTWVKAEQLTRGVSDNCGLTTTVARRKDWLQLLNVCDSVIPVYHHPGGDTLWLPRIATSDNAGKTYSFLELIKDLETPGASIEHVILNASLYAILRYTYEHCFASGGGSATNFDDVFRQAYLQGALSGLFRAEPSKLGCGGGGTDVSEESDLEKKIRNWKSLGGGWSKYVPVFCSDACKPVPTEVLAIDPWCNWAKGWSAISVEYQSSVSVIQELTDKIQISCRTFKHSGLESIVSAASTGDVVAIMQLDEYFGGYEQIETEWQGYELNQDKSILPSQLPIESEVCRCTTRIEQVQVNLPHQGLVWKDTAIRSCFYELDSSIIDKGLYTGSCLTSIQQEQEVWSNLDRCGEGTIWRKWKFWSGCKEVGVDTLFKLQTIKVDRGCPLDEGMFLLPEDTVVDACELVYAGDGSGLISGAADPINTGWPIYLLEEDCQQIAIGRSDKAFKTVGGDKICWKIVRTWYMADWCEDNALGHQGPWWHDPNLDMITFNQTILVRDTVLPTIIIDGPVAMDDTIHSIGCSTTIDLTVSSTDVCGLSSLSDELIRYYEGEATVISTASGEMAASEQIITLEDLSQGRYVYRVRVIDQCQNESYEVYRFHVLPVKKPSPVCVSVLKATLVPVDLDADGVIDTSLAMVDAGAFNAGSQAACGGSDEEIEYRLDVLDQIGDSTPIDDHDYLVVGCSAVPVIPVRLWVIDPSGSYDYCDVTLEVENLNPEGCAGSVSVQSTGNADMLKRKVITTIKQKRGESISTLDGLSGLGRANQDALFELYQNYPNPFSQETTIGFTLPTASKAMLTFYDVHGRMLKQIRGTYGKGYHEVTIQGIGLDSRGLIYYQLDTEVYTASRRMILLD